MATHRVTINTDPDGKFWAKCKCPWSSGFPHFDKRWEAEDAERTHLENVQRALAALRKGRGSLKTDMDHAARMMEDPNTPKEDREVWRIVHEGVRQRLGLAQPSWSEPDPLF